MCGTETERDFGKDGDDTQMTYEYICNKDKNLKNKKNKHCQA